MLAFHAFDVNFEEQEAPHFTLGTEGRAGGLVQEDAFALLSGFHAAACRLDPMEALRSE